jgi:hypothetical protein
LPELELGDRDVNRTSAGKEIEVINISRWKTYREYGLQRKGGSIDGKLAENTVNLTRLEKRKGTTRISSNYTECNIGPHKRHICKEDKYLAIK